MQPFLSVVCFGMAWLFLGLLAWNLWALGREGLGVAKQMHQIPCSQCQFFPVIIASNALSILTRPPLMLLFPALIFISNLVLPLV